MIDHLSLGSTPAGEDCLPANHPDVGEINAELERYKAQLARQFSDALETGLVTLRIKSFPHDFGTYKEVCVLFDNDNEEACVLAYQMCELIPEKWDNVPVTVPHSPSAATDVHRDRSNVPVTVARDRSNVPVTVARDRSNVPGLPGETDELEDLLPDG